MRTQLSSDDQRLWEKSCHPAITSDILWTLDVYRAALFLGHLSIADRRAIRAAYQSHGVAEQLATAAGSIGANLAEGYSRSTRSDRLRFLDYALGSTRECIAWYQTARDALPDDVIGERLELLARIRALLLGLIRSFRNRKAAGQFEP